MSFNVAISPDGTVTVIYADTLAALFAEGALEISRASHVEPNNEGQWVADLSPVNGPQLGPFPFRADALAAEVEWLNNALFTGGTK